MFLNRISSKPKKRKQLQSEHKHDGRSERQYVSSQPVQRIPSVHRLRHTQSAPRIEVDAEEAYVESPHDRKRHGSDPSIGSPLDYSFQIPQIRRTSITPSASWCPGSSEEGMMRACGRHDLITPEDYFDDMPETPEFDVPSSPGGKYPIGDTDTPAPYHCPPPFHPPSQLRRV